MKHPRLLPLLATLPLLFSVSCKTDDFVSVYYTVYQDEAATPYEEGLRLIGVLDEMAANESYLSSVSPSLSDSALLPTLGSHTGDPAATYTLSFSEDLLAAAYPELETDSLSPRFLSYLQKREVSSVTNRLNGQAGVEALALTSVLTVGTTLPIPVQGNSLLLTEHTAYLYFYDTGVPVLVTYLVGEGNTASVSASFLLYDGLPTEEDALSSFFAENFGASLRAVEKEAAGPA